MPLESTVMIMCSRTVVTASVVAQHCTTGILRQPTIVGSALEPFMCITIDQQLRDVDELALQRSDSSLCLHRAETGLVVLTFAAALPMVSVSTLIDVMHIRVSSRKIVWGEAGHV